MIFFGPPPNRGAVATVQGPDSGFPSDYGVGFSRH